MEAKLEGLTAEISRASTAGAMDRVEALGADYAAHHATLREFYAEWEQLVETLRVPEDS